MSIPQPVTREDRAGAKRSRKNQTSLRTRLALGTALATIAFGYAGRTAYAGVCTGSGGVFSCSGSLNAGSDVTQVKSGSPLSVTTIAGFGIDTYVSGGRALSLTGTGGLSFTDNNASLIKAETEGIRATNNSSGNLSITSTGAVIGDIGRGIYARNNTGTGNLTVNAASVTAGSRALEARNYGTGATTIVATGTVTASAYRGIAARGYASGTDVEITAVNAYGDTQGVYARNSGSGFISVTTTGTVSGNNSSGIFVHNENTGVSGATTVNAHNVNSNSLSAIEVDHYGAAALSVTVDGTVTGGGIGEGMRVTNSGSGATSITLNSGASVSSSTGNAIIDSGNTSEATVTVNSGASVTGTIRLQGGNDALIFNGGDFSGVTSFDGGTGTDSLSFNGLSGTLAGGSVVNMENVSIGLGSNISVSGTLDTDTVTVSGTLGGSGLLNADVSVQAGGTLGPGNSPGLLTIVGNLDLDVSSTTLIEIAGLTAGSQYDRIDVSDDPGTGATVEGIATLVAGAFFDIDFFGGFNGGLGDVGLGDFFDVLAADDIVGNVGTLNFNFSGALLGAGLLWDASIVTISGGADDGREALRLSVVEEDAPPLPLATPTSLPLMLAGLLGMVGLGRGRRRRGG